MKRMSRVTPSHLPQTHIYIIKGKRWSKKVFKSCWMYKFLFLFTLLWAPNPYKNSSLSYGQGQPKVSAEEINTSAIKKYKKEKFSEALENWSQLQHTQENLSSPEMLHNLGLAEYQLKNFGVAIAHLRQASHIRPLSLKIQRSLDWVIKKTEKKIYNKVIQDPLKLRLLNKIPYVLLIFLFSSPLVFSTYIAMRYNSKNTTSFSFFKPFILGSSFSLIFLGLLMYKSHLDTHIFATFTGNLSYPLYSAPRLDAPQLGHIHTGDSFQMKALFNNILPKEPDSISTTPSATKSPPKDSNNSDPWILISTPITPFAWLKTHSFHIHRGSIDAINTKN